jgi:hypothetical protein
MVSTILNRGVIHTNVKDFLASNYDDMITMSLNNVAPGSHCLCIDTFKKYI